MLSVALAVCVVVTSDDLTPLPPITPNTPPEWFARLLPSLKVGALSKRECAALMADPVTRVYIAAAILGDDQPKDRVLNALFRDSVWADRAKQREGWQKAGRIDLIAEAAVVAGRADPDVAGEAYADLMGCLEPAIDDKLPAVVKARFDPWTDEEKEEWERRWKKAKDGLPMYFSRPSYRTDSFRFPTTYSWPTLRIGYGKEGDKLVLNLSGAALADRIEFHNAGRSSLGLAVASDAVVNATPISSPSPDGAVLVCNGSIELAGDGSRASSAGFVLIADGDITLPGGTQMNGLCIARRGIRIDGKSQGYGGVYVAGDKITSDRRLQMTSATLLATNGIFAGDPNVAGPDKSAGIEVAGVGPADLGLRWFELADVGMEVIADGKTAVVKRVAEKSPFHGRLEPKDVLTAVNGTKVTTPDECRRALRRAVVLGYAVVDVQRGGKPINRLVRIEDVMK